MIVEIFHRCRWFIWEIFIQIPFALLALSWRRVFTARGVKHWQLLKRRETFRNSFFLSIVCFFYYLHWQFDVLFFPSSNNLRTTDIPIFPQLFMREQRILPMSAQNKHLLFLLSNSANRICNSTVYLSSRVYVTELNEYKRLFK